MILKKNEMGRGQVCGRMLDCNPHISGSIPDLSTQNRRLIKNKVIKDKHIFKLFGGKMKPTNIWLIITIIFGIIMIIWGIHIIKIRGSLFD